MAKKNTNNMGTMAAVTAAAVATAAGAYWLYGAKNASKHRKTAKSWMLKARAEVMDAVEKAGQIDKKTYLDIVDKVVKGYAAVAGAQSKEIQQLVGDLKSSWQYMQTQKKPAMSRAKAVKKSARRIVKKAGKKR
jgi:uncharacterized protein YecA (UPF0149 family)